MNECFFCKCVGTKNFQLENELAIARFDGHPVNDGHMVVVTKRHVKDWWGTTPEERVAIFELLDEAKGLIEEKYKPDGYNIGMNLGEKAGQTVMHLHVHIIPRYEGDVPNPKGGVRGVIPEKQKY